jgi:hypothetical protein
MRKLRKGKQKIEIEVTDEQISGNAGLRFVSEMASRLQVREALASTLHVKQRARGCSDAEMVLGLIYSLASGNGVLRDLEAFRQDSPTLTLSGLERAPGSRRLGEYLAKFSAPDVDALLTVTRGVTAALLPEVCAREIADRGYVPVFIDGSEIEVSGRYYEEARKGYSGQIQYWLHGIFVGGLWASGRLCPGGGDVAADWRGQLEADVRPVLAALAADPARDDATTAASALPVWVSMDNAYYRRECVEYLCQQGWDYSISVTNGTYKRPILRQAQAQSPEAWSAISAHEDATILTHRPDGWAQPQSYLVIRSEWDGLQRLAFPRHTVICVSRCDLPIDELVRRHRHKQGMENEFKGPLDALDLHHPPCLRFFANQAFYACGQLAHLLLRAVQYHLLPPTAVRCSIRTLIHDVIRTVARVVQTGRRCIARFVKTTYRLDWIHHAACQIE